MFNSAASEFVYTRTYSRWIEELKRRETWPETVDRVVSFLKEETQGKVPEKVFKKIREGMLNLSVMPSMRLVWSAGKAAKKENIAMYNCSFLPVDSIESFSEALYILMCGTGVGFSVEKQYTDKLPKISPLNIYSKEKFVVSDDKAGWADSLKFLITKLYEGIDVEFDYSSVRPKGARLNTMGGRSGGPEPLILLHGYVKEVFSQAQGRQLTTLECHDLMNQIAEIVVVGGVRRSSQISFSDLDDKEMRDAKIFPFPQRRAMANNSAIYTEKPTAVQFLKEWAALAESGSGERGIFNLYAVNKKNNGRRDFSKVKGSNPCVTGDTEILTKDGYIRIDSLVDKEVEIWNGFEWSLVTPKITGHNQQIVEVSFKSGKTLKCTSYHSFYLELYNDYTIGSEEYSHIRPISAERLKLEDNIKYWFTPEGEKIRDFVVGLKYLGIEKDVYCFNEPKRHTGVFNGILTGQCSEILLRSRQFCNLSEVVVRPDDDLDSLLDKIETATWIGAIQATFTDFPYLIPEWKKNCEEERLLGVSLTGQFDNPTILTPEALKVLKSRSIKVAKHAANKLNINIPTAITTCKPSGTVSQLVNSSSGIHPRYAKFYIRRYRISSIDPLFKMMRDQGVKFMPENGEENTPEDKVNTWVVGFPIKSPEGCITKDDVSAIDQLEWYKRIQKNWCEHNASITVYVKDDEWFNVGNWVYQNWDIVNGISFLPFDGGKYKQAPYETITEEQYNKLVAKQIKIDYTQLSKYETEDQTQGAASYSCTGDRCEIV